MRTQPTESAEPNYDRLQDFADQINLNSLAVADLIRNYPGQSAVLEKVLSCFVGVFTWSKAFAVLHSDAELANQMIPQVAAALGIQLPQKPFAESR